MPELSKTYEPATIEEKWYAQWLADGDFTADPASKKPAYSIVIPPPNVTGMLTLGHVLNNTIQDILARRARMTGHEVLWLPGTDHAGIATQTVVERTLKKSGAIRHRDDLGREAFLAKVWEWKEKHGGIIIQQLKKLGASCDWSRERFTMDPEYSACVTRVFVELYKKGLIYRGKRMVNWCPASLTALSDEEVIMKPQNGTMYYFRVTVAEEPQTWLTIATTRPETIPGDTAIAVNPHDPRYARLIGKHVIRPLPLHLFGQQKLIPIIGDAAVDFEFGTGVLKVTPAHDKADFEIGQRHRLAAVDIMNPDATMNALAGKSLVGLDRFEARNVAVDHLRQLGVLVKEEPHQNNVGYSERADVPIEPRLSLQWFLKYPSVEQALACVLQPGGLAEISPGQRPGYSAITGTHPGGVLEGSAAPAGAESVANGSPRVSPGANIQQPSGLPAATMRFFPERWAKVYDHWLGGIQDWCISRQLWWGHRIPVWYRREKPDPAIEAADADAMLEAALRDGADDLAIPRKELQAHVQGPTVPHLAEPLSEPTDAAIHASGGAKATVPDHDIYVGTEPPPDAENWVQDSDVLDTWFSSWLWPFATMGWTGDKTADAQNPLLAKFHPTTDLVTGPDIIFFWVARMIMAALEFTGELPFKNVYFTGLIRDKQGRKMSKSLGNSPDPLDLIASFGADALRLGIMRAAPVGADILFDEKNVELGRNFCTKLWNAARFRQMHGGESEGEIDPALLSSDDRWILLRLDGAIREVTLALEEYRFSDAANGLYRFFWGEFCDWYLEASKAALGNLGFRKEDLGSEEGAAPESALPQSEILNPKSANTLAVIDFTLAHTLRLMHPFLPFITEELWHALGFQNDLPNDQGGRTIMFAHWPAAFDDDFKAHYGLTPEADAEAIAKYETVTLGRGLRRDSNIASNKRVRFVIKPSAPLRAHDASVLKILLNAEALELDAAYLPPRGTPVALTPLGELFLPLEGLVDVAAERERLGKEIAKVEQELAKVCAKLASETFVNGAPANVVADHRKRESDWREKLAQLERMAAALG